MIDPLNPTTLKAAREAAGLSRAELAEKSGVHETTILRIEKGEVDPRVDATWAKLVRATQSSGDVCETCQLRLDDPAVSTCASAGCTHRRLVAA